MAGQYPTAFVFSGGGNEVASEIGMLFALTESGIRPDLILGSSAGAWLGAIFAAQPDRRGLTAISNFWAQYLGSPRLSRTFTRAVLRLFWLPVQEDTQRALRVVLARHLPIRRFEDLPVPFQCSGISLRSGQIEWFSKGELLTALLAASAAPVLQPPAFRDGTWYLDGGLVDLVPLRRALSLGARTIYILPATDLRPLFPFSPRVEVPPVNTTLTLRFQEALQHVPEGTAVHILPLGRRNPPLGLELYRRMLRLELTNPFRDSEEEARLAYRATIRYLADHADT
ncbi:patatin-like phospholipase family protein [Streptomyces chrestomyceticus]|uniref:patatin-like phospholipase family protein n=1 Tax=Streptomyces chrestomyceticus TaxID=68185 RepID=UPI0033C4735C